MQEKLENDFTPQHCVCLRFKIAYFFYPIYKKFWLLTPELGNLDVIMQNKQFKAAKNSEKKLELGLSLSKLFEL